MKRRFRQKQDMKPKDDPEKDKGSTDDAATENVNIDEIIEEIDTQLKTAPDPPEDE